MLLIQGLIYNGNLNRLDIALGIIDKMYPNKKHIHTKISSRYQTSQIHSTEYYPWHITTIAINSNTPKIIELLIKHHFPFFTSEYGQFSNVFTVLFTVDLTKERNLTIVNESLKLILETNTFKNDFKYKSSSQKHHSNNCIYELLDNPYLQTSWWADINQDPNKKEFINILCKHFDLLSKSINYQHNFIEGFIKSIIKPKFIDVIPYIIFNLYLHNRFDFNGLINHDTLNISDKPNLDYYLNKANSLVLAHFEEIELKKVIKTQTSNKPKKLSKI